MQLSELIAAVRDEVQDPSATRWTDATITRYLNEAQLDLAQISRKTTTLVQEVQPGTTYVVMPGNMLLPKEFWFEVYEHRYRMDVGYGVPPETSIVTGYPLKVYIDGNMLWLYPTSAYQGNLLIVCTLRPVNMVNPTDVPSVEDADHLLIAYAAWMCLKSDGDPMAREQERYYNQKKLEWSVLDAQKNPMPSKIDREWWY